MEKKIDNSVGLSESQVSAIMAALNIDDQKKNALQYPKIFYCRHMEAGLAGYESETILVGHDCIKKMMPSFQGKPVYVDHVEEVDLENIQNEAHGYVVETFFLDLDGWVWSKFIVVDDLAFEAIAKGWAVSNAYVPTKSGRGGTHHNCRYDREIFDAEFTHLAIVPNPRYESSCVMSPDEFKKYCEDKREEQKQLVNSKSKKGLRMFSFYKNKREEVSEIDEDTMIEIKNDNGEVVDTVSFKNMVDAVQNKKNEDDEKEQKCNMDQMVKVGDEEMSLKELANRYQKMSSKKNADDEDEKSNEGDDEDEKKNESEEKDEKKNSDDNEDEKKNAKSEKDEKHFKALKNAGDKGQVVNVIDSQSRKVQRGQERYG